MVETEGNDALNLLEFRSKKLRRILVIVKK